MKRVSKLGLGEGLFAGWRYLDRGKPTERPNDGFVLNQPAYDGASILLTGDNMGCGSSREHAVWALKDYGIRSIIAPGFGAIFYSNCIRNGLLPVVLEAATIADLAEQITTDPRAAQLEIDVSSCVVKAPDGQAYEFSLEPLYHKMLTQGLDAIDITGKSFPEIEAFKRSDRIKRPWSYLE